MKIVAIGGGEIGRPRKPEDGGGNYPIETELIDREIILLTGKANPKALLLPTASSDDPGYYTVFQKHYGQRLGCKTDVLYLVKETPSLEEIRRKILGTDIIYVGGGNTQKMLEVWRRLGVDKVLEEAGNKGIVLSGVSAGAICWFKYGNSDSLKFETGSKELIRLDGLSYIPLMACPHYDVEEYRRPSLKKMVGESGEISIALGTCSAFEVVDNRYRIITSSEKARAFKLHKKGGEVIEEKLPLDKKFRSIESLLKK